MGGLVVFDMVTMLIDRSRRADVILRMRNLSLQNNISCVGKKIIIESWAKIFLKFMVIL